MDQVISLHSSFGKVAGLRFRDDPSGLVFLDIESDAARASLCLQGAQVLLWQPEHARDPVLWLSDHAKAAKGKSLRGGIPVCWPWFGPHASEAGAPAHGFARNLAWSLAGAWTIPGGGVEVLLALPDPFQEGGPWAGEAGSAMRAFWPHQCSLELRASFGRSLELELVTRNAGDRECVVGEALHSYFRVGDILETRVLGLESCEYEDRVGTPHRARQQGAVTFAGETDRVYIDPAPDCVIDDPILARRIHLRTRGSASTVLWTPWKEKAARLGDLGEGDRAGAGWRGMVCVESANALERSVRVPPRGVHRMGVEITVSTP
jgi:D-hexose-6-phosphate mutarotase